MKYMSTTIHWSYILYRWQQIMTVQTQDSICYLNNDIRLSDRLICAKFRIEYKNLHSKKTFHSADFTTTNDPIVTTDDSCAAPLNSNRKFTVKPCGRERISYDDCYHAGCCYQNSECHLPVTEEKVDYLFFKEKMRYREAYRTCRKSGWNLSF